MSRLPQFPALTGPLPSTAEVPPPVAAALEAVRPHLDGRTRLEHLVGRMLAEGVELEPLMEALEWLRSQGLLGEGEAATRGLPEAQLQRYSEQIRALASLRGEVPGLDTRPRAGVQAQAALSRSTVVVAGLGETGVELLRLLAQVGVGTLVGVDLGAAVPEERLQWLRSEVVASDPGVRLVLARALEDLSASLAETRADLFVHCPDVFESATAEALNELCLESSVPLLLYRLDLNFVDLGPLVVPRETACYVCYRLRREAASSDGPVWYPGTPPRLRLPLGVDLLALEVLKLLGGVGEPATRSRLIRLDLSHGRTDSHPVLRLPRCPACGTHRAHPVRKLWEE